MLKSQTLENRKEFLTRELTRYGGVDFKPAYNFVERDIMANTNGVEEEEMLGILDFLKETYCHANLFKPNSFILEDEE